MIELNKNMILILLILFNTIIFSQNINNKMIDERSAVEKICKLQKISKINQKILKWRHKEIYGEYENGIPLFDMVGILKNDSIIRYFNNADLKFVEQQYNNNDILWSNNLKKIKILDSLTIAKLDKQAFKTHKMEYYYHSISNPLFSLNGQFMIIKIDYFCGFMCSNQCIYLFKKNNKSWKLITEWSCLAS